MSKEPMQMLSRMLLTYIRDGKLKPTITAQGKDKGEIQATLEVEIMYEIDAQSKRALRHMYHMTI
jgi:hypothetical protein